jgi:hypothetical protein
MSSDNSTFEVSNFHLKCCILKCLDTPLGILKAGPCVPPSVGALGVPAIVHPAGLYQNPLVCVHGVTGSANLPQSEETELPADCHRTQGGGECVPPSLCSLASFINQPPSCVNEVM